jgi:hypothetical protein
MAKRATHCRSCGVERSSSNFTPSQRSSLCASCRYQNYRKNRQTPKAMQREREGARAYRARKWAHMLALNTARRSPSSHMTEADVLALWERQRGLCAWFGIPMDRDAPPRDPARPSIDRLDVDGPYSPENTVLACIAANLGRQRASVERWAAIVAAIKLASARDTANG